MGKRLRPVCDGRQWRNQTNLTPGDFEGSEPSWSPDSTKILFTGYVSGENDTDIYVMDSDGGNVVNITNTPNDGEAYPRFSPNGTKIVFESETGVVVMDADGSNPLLINSDTSAAMYDWGVGPPAAIQGDADCDGDVDEDDVLAILGEAAGQAGPAKRRLPSMSKLSAEPT